MRKALLVGAAALAVLTAGAASAQRPRPAAPAPAERNAQWTTGVYQLSWRRVPASQPRPDSGGGFALPAAASSDLSWILPEDLPAQYRNRTFSSGTVIELEINPLGLKGACNILLPGSEPELAQLACRLARDRVQAGPYYAAPGRPVASRLEISIGFETSRVGAETVFTPPRRWTPGPPAPPLPPPPIRLVPTEQPGPRLDWPGHVTVASLPTIQNMFPAGSRRRQGRVSLDLQFNERDGITGCTVVESARDAALDAEACRIAPTLDVRYLYPCESCRDGPLPLQFVWNRGGGSHIRLPLMPHHYPADWPDLPRDPADSRTARRLERPPTPQRVSFTTADFARVRDRTMRRKTTSAEILVSPQGRGTLCLLQSTGNWAIDLRACRLVMNRGLPIRRDVFGDPTASRQRVVIDLTAVE